jgi:hypothetical protein
VIAGYVYGHYGEKAVLALKYIATRTQHPQAATWDGNVATLESALGITRPEAMAKLQEITGLDAAAATRLLWDTYSPNTKVWIPFACVGVLSAIALWIFGRKAKKWADMDA